MAGTPPGMEPVPPSPQGIDGRALDLSLAGTSLAGLSDNARTIYLFKDELNDALMPDLRSGLRRVHILGRRGPHQASFTLKEVGELGELELATPLVRPEDFPPVEADAALETGQRRVVEVLRKFAAAGPDPEKRVVVQLDFFHRPLKVLGNGRVEAIEVMRTRLDADGRAVDTGETEIIPCGLVVAAIGYRTSPVPGVPYDTDAGRFANVDGLISDGLWCVGWARRGPSGTIGTNRPDGFALVDRIAADEPPWAPEA